MNRLLVVTLALTSVLIAETGNAQGLMPPHVAAQLGLTQLWARPVHVPYGAQSIADQQLFVHQSCCRS